MVGATLAEPLAEPGSGAGLWLDRWRDASFTNTLVTEAGGGNGWSAASPVLVLLVAALCLAAWSLPRVVLSRRDVVPALVAFGTWVVLAHAAPDLLEPGLAVDQVTGLATVVALLAVAVLPGSPRRGSAPPPRASSFSRPSSRLRLDAFEAALLVVLASGAIVGLSFTRMAART